MISYQGVTSRLTLIGGSTAGTGRIAATRWTWISMSRNIGGFPTKSSVPDGYQSGVAWGLAVSTGGMVCSFQNPGTLSGSIIGAGNIVADISGLGSISNSNLASGINLVSTINASGSVSTTIYGKGVLVCDLSIGSRPTATDIAQALLNTSLSGFSSTNNVADALKKTLKRDEFLGLQ